MSAGIHPVGRQVLVSRDPRQDKVGLLFTPDGSQVWPSTGTVLALGPRAFVDAAGVEQEGVGVGARIQFASRPGSALFPDDREDKNHPWLGLVMLLDEDIQMELLP